MKQGGQIIYYIDVHNDSDTTLKNVLVRDAVPELSSYIEGSASNNGKIMEINGKQYVTYVIDTLRAEVHRPFLLLSLWMKKRHQKMLS